MRLWRIIAVATAAEFAGLSAAAGVLGLVGGAASEWLDLFAEAALPGLAVSALALSLSLSLSLSPSVAPGGALRERRILIGAALIGLGSSVAMLAPDTLAALAGLAAAPQKGPSLKVVQFNVWRENITLEAAARRIKASDPDIVALEETDDFPEFRLHPFAAAFPFHTDCRDVPGCGLVIYSKRPVRSERVERRQLYPGAREANILTAVYDGPDGRPLTIVVTHLGWPVPPGFQDVQWPPLQDAVQAAGRRRVVLLGDFNLSVSAHTLRRLEHRLWPLTRRDHLIMTYPATIPRLRLKWPLPIMGIDHIFATPDLEVTRVHRLGNAGSDHYPIMATVGPAG